MEGGDTRDIPLKRCASCRTQTFCWEGSDCLVEGENTMAGSRFESVFYKNRNYSVMYRMVWFFLPLHT